MPIFLVIDELATLSIAFSAKDAQEAMEIYRDDIGPDEICGFDWDKEVQEHIKIFEIGMPVDKVRAATYPMYTRIEEERW